jgi:uridine kinase
MTPFIIGICGGSGSGKTTFIKGIRSKFSESEVCIISQDDYYKPRHEQKKDPKGIENYDLPKSIDKKALLRDIEKLKAGERVEIKEYVFNNDRSAAKTIVIKPAPVIIVEGLFVFHYKKMSRMYDLRVFISAKESLKVIRRIIRDQIERNYPADDVLYRYEHHVLPSFERYIAPYRETADIVVNNNDNFKLGLEVMEGFIKHKLLQMAESV